MSLPEAGVQLVADGLSGFMSDMGKANKEVADFGKSGEKSGNIFNKGFGEIVTGTLREVGAMAVQALGAATKAVGGFIKDSVGLAGDFEAGMLNFQAVAGKSVDTKGLEQFKDLFLSLGKELPVSTADVQAAAIEMVKGGIDPATIAAGGLRQNIQFAAAAMDGDLVKAAEISSKILGGWTSATATATEKADFLTHSTDLLTKAANASSVDVEGLSQGIFNAQGIAKVAGVKFDDLTTTLALLAPRFASSAEAGTSVKNMIARLQPTTKPAIAAMQSLGLYTKESGSAFYDAQGNFVGFEKASGLLQESLKGLTKEQQASLLQTIFGNDAMSAAAGLADGGAEAYRVMTQALADANGVQANAALKQQGFNTALDNAKGSVEALQITIGTALLPVLTDLMNNVIAPAINTLTDMADAIFGNDEAFNRLSPTMQEVVSTIGTVIIGTQKIINAFDDAGASSVEFAQTIGELASDLGLPGELIQDIVFATQDLIGAFQDGGAAIQVAGAIFNGQVSNYQTLFSTLGTFIPGILASISTITEDVLGQISLFWKNNGDEVMAFVTNAMSIIGDIYNTVLKIVLTLVGDKLATMSAYFHEHGDQIQQVIQGAWDVIKSVIDIGLTFIQGALHIALDIINGDWSKAWEDLKKMSADIVLDIQTAITGFLDIIAAAFGTTLDDIWKVWQDNFSKYLTLAQETADDMVQVGSDIVNGIKQGINDAWGSFMSWVDDQINKIPKAVRDVLGISSPSKVMAEQVGQPIVQGMISGIQSMLPELLSTVADMGDELTNAAQDIADAVSDIMQSGFTATASMDRQKIKNLDQLATITDRLKGGVQYLLEDAEKTAMGIADPKQSAAWFKQRSEQIFELADISSKLDRDLSTEQKLQFEENMRLYQTDLESLKKADPADEQANAQRVLIMQRMADIQAKLDNDLTDTQRDALHTRYQLVNAAQLNETKAADIGRQQGGDLQSLLQTMYGALAAGLPVNDTGIGAMINQFADQASAMISGPASAQQIAAGGAGGTTYASSTSYSMPIYTNNTPAALQQSLAVAQALTPS